jgi:hypothetical protein
MIKEAAMLRTLVDLARTHRFPFIAEHKYASIRYLVVGQSMHSDVIFEVIILPRERDVPDWDADKQEVYGGYEMWRFEKEVDKKSNISPEEQKRIREEQRRKENEATKRRYRLKEGDTIRSATRKAPPKKHPVRVAEEENVIAVDFRNKNN